MPHHPARTIPTLTETTLHFLPKISIRPVQGVSDGVRGVATIPRLMRHYGSAGSDGFDHLPGVVHTLDNPNTPCFSCASGESAPVHNIVSEAFGHGTAVQDPDLSIFGDAYPPTSCLKGRRRKKAKDNRDLWISLEGEFHRQLDQPGGRCTHNPSEMGIIHFSVY